MNYSVADNTSFLSNNLCHPLYEAFHEPSMTVTVTTISTMLLQTILLIPVIFGNCLVAFVLLKDRRLHQKSNILLGFLTFTDLGTGFATIPLSISTKILALIGQPNCSLFLICQLFAYVFSGLSFITVTLLTVERGLAIIFPFKYISLVTGKRIACVTLVLWCLLLNFYLTISIKLIPMNWITKVAVVIIGFCLVLILSIDIKIFVISRRHRRSIQQQDVLSSSNKANCLKELAFAMTMIVVFVGLFVCYFPMFVIIVKIVQNGANVHTMHVLLPWAETLVFANSVANFCIYFLRLRKMRNSVRSLFSCWSRDITNDVTSQMQ